MVTRVPLYEVESRSNGTVFAVMRTGKRGGKRFISAYPAKHQAESVRDTLNRWRFIER